MLDLSNKKQYYQIFRKKKPNSNSYRVIYSPNEEIKQYHCAILEKLKNHYISPHCYAFIKGKGVKEAALNHIKKDWLITIDIDNFFPSITKNHLLSLGLNDYEAELCTINNSLIQGLVCSPHIANCVISPVVDRIHKCLSRKNISVSFYCDDCAISGYGKPKHLYVNYINDVLNEYGFKLNKKKTKWMFKNQEMTLLGCTVNEKVSINWKKRKSLKNELKYTKDNSAIIGKISHIGSINKAQYFKLLNTV